MTRKRIAFYLRHPGNLHYFAALKPYLDYFLDRHHCRIVVREPGFDREYKEYTGYTGYHHLFANGADLDAYDLVQTPTHLREHEINSRSHVVQIFHGISDKPFTYDRDFSDYRLCLCAGQRQVERLMRNEKNCTMRFAVTGYPKFDHIPSLPALFDNGKPTVIYCPTWRKDGLSSIEIFLDHPEIVAGIAADYNLIVKPHPNLFNPAREFFDSAIVDRLRRIPGIKLVHEGNVMPWLAQADLFVGDISATGYEWLYFERPMVFLNPKPGVLSWSANVDDATYLWQCGDVCDDIRELKRLIAGNVRTDYYRSNREQLLHYSVHDPRGGQATARGVAEIEKLLCALPAECLE